MTTPHTPTASRADRAAFWPWLARAYRDGDKDLGTKKFTAQNMEVAFNAGLAAAPEAAVLHYMLGFYLSHGAGWVDACAADMERRVAERAAAPASTSTSTPAMGSGTGEGASHG